MANAPCFLLPPQWMVADYDMGDSVASSTKKKNTKSLSMRAQTVEVSYWSWTRPRLLERG